MEINGKIILHNLTQNQKYISEGLGIKEGNLIKLNCVDDFYQIKIENNINFKKENNITTLIYDFMEDKNTENKYLIKSTNQILFIKIKTLKIVIKDGIININYETYINDECEKYSLNIEYEEVNKWKSI